MSKKWFESSKPFSRNSPTNSSRVHATLGRASATLSRPHATDRSRRRDCEQCHHKKKITRSEVGLGLFLPTPTVNKFLRPPVNGLKVWKNSPKKYESRDRDSVEQYHPHSGISGRKATVSGLIGISQLQDSGRTSYRSGQLGTRPCKA